MKLKTTIQLIILLGAIGFSSCSRLYTSRNYVKGGVIVKTEKKNDEKKSVAKTENAGQLPASVPSAEIPPALQSPVVNALPVNFEKEALKAAKQKVHIPAESQARSIADKKTQAPQISEQGIAVPAPIQKSGEKSQLVALLLCFFLGYIGIHRFYLGYTLIGIIQIVTLGGCGIWALIDFIMILTGDLQPKNGPYDKTFDDY